MISQMRIFSPLLILSLIVSVDLMAREDEHNDMPADPFEYDESLKEKWKELESKIPAYPKNSDLLDTDIGGGEDPYEYQIDSKNLEAGTDDVVRYTVVISSPSGTRNVMYEGINCSTSAYKTYAYGSQNKFIPARNPRWRPVRKTGRIVFRYNLASSYFCGKDSMFSLPTKEIIRRIQYEDDAPPMGGELGVM